MHKVSESYKAYSLLHPQTMTSTTNGAAVDLGDDLNDVMVTLDVGAITGASTTYDFKVQGSPDGSTGWADITGGAFTQLDETGDNKLACLGVKLEGSAQRYVRAVATLAGGTPSVDVCMTAHVLAERGGSTLNSATAA